MHWMLLPYKRYFDFSGRSRRKEYWLFFLFVFIVEAIVFLIIFSQVPLTDEAIMAMQANGSPSALFFWGFALLAIFGLATIIPSIAVQVRRFHDQDKSGWMVLLNLVPAIGGLIVLVFMCLEGTKGPNRYGPDPKDPAGAAAFA